MKKIYVCFCTLLVVPLIMLDYEVALAETDDFNQVEYFRIENIVSESKNQLAYVNWWYSNADDCFYLFLPATAENKSLKVSYKTQNDAYIFLDETKLESGKNVDLFSEKDEFSVYVGNEYIGKLKVMRSDISSIYINSQEGDFDDFLKNRDITLHGDALMVDSSGSIFYQGIVEKISAHGNSSWNYLDKKSYNIKLPQKSDLYGLGKAKKWMLISNGLDQSLLRNGIGIELSRNLKVDPTLDYTYVDLYTNGLYRGCYQLLERIEVQKNRVNIADLEKKTESVNDKELQQYDYIIENADFENKYIENSCMYYDIPNNPPDITGGYLLEFQMWNRYGMKSSSGFVTSRGQALDIKSPEYTSAAQMNYLRTFVQNFEDAVYSDTGYNSQGKHYSEYIDVDSLVRAYLVQEVTMNVDATFASFFLWKDSDKNGDGKIHFGPSWDFDLSMNNFYTYYNNGEGVISYSSNPDNIFVANFPVNGFKLHQYDTGSGRNTCGLSWISKLYRRKEFRKRVSEIYFDECEQFLRKLCDSNTDGKSHIKEMADSIRASVEMNNARWNTFGSDPLGKSNGATFDECIGYISDFLFRRCLYLSNLWHQEIKSGDVNNDGYVNMLDIVALKKYLLFGENKMKINKDYSDLNSDGIINVLDLDIIKSITLY